MRRLEPGNRLVVAVLGILTVLTLSKWVVVAALGLTLVLISAVQHKLWSVWRGFRLASPFLLTTLLLGWFSSGGWSFAGLLLLKLTVLVCWNSWIFAGLTELELIRGLKEVRVPYIFVLTIFFILRYRELLREEMRDLRLAREIRGGRLQKRFAFRDYRMLGQVMGAGLVRALDRGDRVYQAMRLRGLKAETLIRVENRFRLQPGWLVMMVLMVGVLIFLDRGGFL